MENVCKNCKWVHVENFKSPGTQEITETFRCFHKSIPVTKQPQDFCSFFESTKSATVEPIKVKEVIKQQKPETKITKKTGNK